MPRRILSLLLALCCLLAGTGVAMQQHRCMGETVGTALAPVAPPDHHRCDRCGMERKAAKGCCEDVVKVFKAKDAHRFYPAPYHLPVLEWAALPAAPFRLAPAPPAPRQAEAGRAFASRPPPLGRLPRYLRLRVLRL